MNHATHNSLANFIWGIADDVLRDVYVRGKYRDVILPMTVIRRIDSLLEPTKQAVIERHKQLDQLHIFNQGPQLCKVAGFDFYNTSEFTLKSLINSPGHVRANFEVYLDGFSDNVQQIISKFKFRNQMETLDEANVLYLLLKKFTAKEINLSPKPTLADDGTVIHEGLSNLGMGYVFEELIRRFNEENNEEAGEHFTPRDIVELMAELIFLPIQDEIQGTTYRVYDPACGSGGMLTEAEQVLDALAKKINKRVVIELYGQEVNPETFAICQSDMLIKERNPSQIRFGSTLSKDGFPRDTFDFMLSNPPYGKSWQSDKAEIVEEKKQKNDDGIKDPRFKNIGVPSVSDGQLLFLVNMLSKMKTDTPTKSRIATVHNGSALFTGDAGQGESNIRKWIIENDWLECIIGLPLNMFYNTGIATYIWVLTNRKPEHRKGKIQLIDATDIYTKLRKNLGKKNCIVSHEQRDQIVQTFLDFADNDTSRVFDNDDFGYRKICVERPLRLRFQVTPERLQSFRDALPSERAELADAVERCFGADVADDYNAVKACWAGWTKAEKFKTTKKDSDLIQAFFAEKCPDAIPVLRGTKADGSPDYEPDAELRDFENVPNKEDIEEYFAREVLPYVPDAWIDYDKTVAGYEISFTKVFYKYQPLRDLSTITDDILALDAETEGLLHQILGR